MALLTRIKKKLASVKKQTGSNNDVKTAEMESKQDTSFLENKPESAGKEKISKVALLTPREHEVYLLLLEGYTLKESAKRLSIKYSTANTHMTGIYRKLEVKSRAELIIGYRSVTN